MEIVDYCMKEYVKLSMKEIGINPLHYVSLSGFSFDCWLMSIRVTLDTLQDKQMLDDFVEAKRGGLCGIIGDRYVSNGNGNSNSNSNNSSKNNSNINSNNNSNDNSNNNRRSRFADSNSNRLLWYVDANNLYGYAMMQKLPYKDFTYSDTSLDVILNTPHDSDHGYYIVCDINYTNSCKKRT